MSEVKFCRICLDNNVRMYQLSGSEVQDVYEKLTNNKVQENGGPYFACYICYCKLKNCHELVVKSRKSEEILRQYSPVSRELVLKPTALSTRLTCGLVNSLTISRMESFQIPEYTEIVNTNQITSGLEMKVKYEPLDDTPLPTEEFKLDTNEQCTPKSIEKIIIKNVYSINKRFKCPYCEYRSVRNNDLKRHIRYHTGEKPYKCQQCSFTSTTCSQLKIHVRTHTGEKPYKCDYCEQAFAQNNSLKIHLRMHTGEKPYKCKYCDYKCGENSTLTTHIRIHTGENPYKCDYCDYTCKQNGNLQAHVRRHTGRKPYICHICFKNFTVSSGLKRHVRVHDTDKKTVNVI